MTLFDAQPPKPPRGIRKYVSAPVLVLFLILVVLAAFGIAYSFWDRPEEQAVARFLTELEQGKFREAYQLWQPSPTYRFQDFVKDWGEQGDYGKIREFEILGSRSKGENTVIVTVRINGENPPLDLLVDRKTKGLAYSVF